MYTRYKATPITKECESYQYSQLVKIWIKKLGLQEEPIFTLFEEEGENSFSHSKITWNPLQQYWEIKYKYPQKKYSIIHELGHLYLYKLDDNLEFHKKKELKIIGQKGIDTFVLKCLDLAYPGFHEKLTYPLRFMEVEPGELTEIFGFTFQTAENN